MKVDGRIIAKNIYKDLVEKVSSLNKKGVTPHLYIILIGSDPASKSYIRQKIRRAGEIGIRVTLKNFPKNTSEKTLVRYIDILNRDKSIHGIIIQRPLPPQISSEALKMAVIPEKDVDGFHPESTFEPPLALAIMAILQEIYQNQTGASFPSSLSADPFKNWLISKNIVFMGRGEAGGKPVISHFEKHKIPHIVIHSKTEKPEGYISKADIIISAVGKKEIIKPDLLKKGVILIGIGLHKESDGRLHGDYEKVEIKDIASFYTPTPGGVGPVNVAMLLQNAIKAVIK